MDKLDDIFALQEQLNDKIFSKQDVRNPGDAEILSTDSIRKALNGGNLGANGLPNTWLRNYLRALQAEAKELEEDLLWKWWSKDEVDIQNVRVEIVDMFHFLVSLGLAAGLDADDMHRLYTKKHKVNEDRQDSGYSKDTKDGADNKTVV